MSNGAAPNPKPQGEMKMRFMMIVKSAEKWGFPPKELMEAIGKLSEEAVKGGSMVGSGGLRPTAQGACVRLKGGQNRDSRDVRAGRPHSESLGDLAHTDGREPIEVYSNTHSTVPYPRRKKTIGGTCRSRSTSFVAP